jgi:hypothetical protein
VQLQLQLLVVGLGLDSVFLLCQGSFDVAVKETDDDNNEITEGDMTVLFSSLITTSSLSIHINKSSDDCTGFIYSLKILLLAFVGKLELTFHKQGLVDYRST